MSLVWRRWLPPPHVSRNWHLPARMRGLPGLHRASPSTPLDVYSYVVGTIASRLEPANLAVSRAFAAAPDRLIGVVIPTVDEPFSRHAEAATPASASHCPLSDGRAHACRRA